MRPWIGSILLCGALCAEKLPVHTFTTEQGLISNTIKKIIRDSRGFIWFCTSQGLSRFDGHDFTSFGQAQGLPGRTAWDITETRSGDYWVATSGGLAKLRSTGETQIQVLHPGETAASRNVLAVREASDGTLWVGASDGLYRLAKDSKQPTKVDTGPLPETWSDPAVTAIEEDGAHNLWFGGFAGLGRIRKSGRIDRWTPRQGFVSYVIAALYRDRDDTIWVGTEQGLCHLGRDAQPGESPAERCYSRQDGLPSLYVQAILRTATGKLWVGTIDGAAYSTTDSPTQRRFTTVTTKQGLPDNDIETLAEDGAGNLWLGSTDDGAVKLAAEDMAFFTEEDGLVSPNVIAVFEDRKNGLYAVTRSDTKLAIHQFDGRAFRPLDVSFPPAVHLFGRGLQQIALQDRQGEWWLATGDGLLHYRAGGPEALRGAPEIYKNPSGPDGANIFRVYEDSRGDIWWSTSARRVSTLGRWDRLRGAMRFFTEADGLPNQARVNPASAFMEENRGALWIGFEAGGLARRRSDGAFEYFDPRKGWPGGRVRSAHRDLKGRLWFGSAEGLWRLDQPGATQPVFRRYTPAEGLSGPTIHTITGDAQGRIYVGTETGVDRLDPESGRVEHFSQSDGFPAGVIQAAYEDRQGALWFATRHGIARFLPQPGPARVASPAVLITTIRAKGMERPISAAGESVLSGLSFDASENHIEFTFASPRSHDRSLLYQYRLEGVRASDWTAATGARTVNFAGLSPGSYKFQVRAGGAEPASVSFRILPPFWAAWWFRSLMALLAAALVYALYRYQIHVALERERLRIRIATDLHDDIGSSLSRIAIWSELAAKELNGASVQRMAQIGDLSREMIDSMSDIVWAVNPKYDRFTDLLRRMRRYASDVSAETGLTISFDVKEEERVAPVGASARREIFLVFKEALNNAVRHAQCTECSAKLSLDSGWIELQVIDNGIGFDPKTVASGQGLESMARRAAQLGGVFTLDSAPGKGTGILIRVARDASGSYVLRWLHRTGIRLP